jgi:octaprenyl-diphosphate synthase
MLVTQPSAFAEAPRSPLPEESLPTWKEIVSPAEPFLQAVAERLRGQINAFERDIAAYAEYALTNQGKQLRPVLVALSGGACGPVEDAHITAAVIIEMVHLATLVHDDVMDEAQIRRGRPTLAANWGSEISVLLGDCLFAHAVELAAGFPSTEVCRAVSAATKAVCSGEILQTQRRRNFELSRAEYFQVIQMKTGELFALSCDLGAFLSGAGALQRSALRQYGLAIGTAYQVYDDCLDLYGSESLAGKSLGTDLAKGKLTLPLLLALEQARPAERSSIEAMVRDWIPGHFPKLHHLLDRYQTREGSRQAVQDYLSMAGDALGGLPDSICRRSLAGLCGYLSRQTAALGIPA